MEVPYIFAIVGLIMVLSGVICAIRRRKFLQLSKVISGIVINYRTRSNRGGKSWYPIVSYYDELTCEKEYYESNFGWYKPLYKKGENVELRYYSNGKYQVVCINSWIGIWGLYFSLIIFGLIFGIAGYSLIYFSR